MNVQLTTPPTKAELSARNFDKFGTLAGTLCTLKCTALPTIAALAPSLSGTLASFSHNPMAHWGFLLLTAPGAYSLAMKEPKNRVTYPVVGATIGISAMFVGSLGHQIAHNPGIFNSTNNSAHSGHMGMDHSSHGDHSHHNHGTSAQGVANMELPKTPTEALMDFSHNAFLVGTLFVLSGHISRLSRKFNLSEKLKFTEKD
jgi:hypothetical protein